MNMKERPILFSGPMVRAILDGTKTQTRRVVKGQHEDVADGFGTSGPRYAMHDGKPWMQWIERPGEIGGCEIDCPYGQPGDRLWVREAFAKNEVLPLEHRAPGEFIYRAELENGVTKYSARWTPSIHMPRRASRITLEITSVRVERLQEISEADAQAEGADIQKECEGGQWIICGPRIGSYREGFRWLWSSTYGADSWAANPWVWVVELKRIPQPDKLPTSGGGGK
jgi:hypothetical protein